MSFRESWFLTVIPIVIAVIMHLVNSNKMGHTHSKLNGVIRNRRDLHLVRDAINTSMTLAIAYMAMFAIYIIAGIILIAFGRIHIFIYSIHIFIFGIITLPIALIGRVFEKRIKNLNVESHDSDIGIIYQDYLNQWNQPRLKIKEKLNSV